MQDDQTGRLICAVCVLALSAVCFSSPVLAQERWPAEHPGAYGEREHPRANQHFHPLEPEEPQNFRGRAGGGIDFDDQRRTDGHMTPEERRLLRQHIEDAVHDLYGH